MKSGSGRFDSTKCVYIHTYPEFFENLQLFFHGLTFHPHVNDETVTELFEKGLQSGTFGKRRFLVLAVNVDFF